MATPPATTDCLVIGGGVIGLSIAYQLAGDGLSVRLIDRGAIGRQASWAGAGILPPASWFSPHPALIPLATLSHEWQRKWSDDLREQTGIDDEYEVVGAYYATGSETTDAHRKHLFSRLNAWSELGVSHLLCPAEAVVSAETALRPFEAVHVPGEAQVRNPRRLAALTEACRRRGVAMETDAEPHRFNQQGGRIESVETARGRFSAGHVCLATGAWTGPLGDQLGLCIPTKPIRGQITLLRCEKRPFRSVVHWGGKYLVPRRDGRVLVGATVEDGGFDTETTESATADLLAFAHRAAPCLSDAELETSWVGLRPASGDELPMIGPLPSFSNAWIAAGHYRSGLQFAPGTAIVVSELLRDAKPACNLGPFDPARFSSQAVTA